MPTSKANANDAEEHLMWNADNADCPGACFRPVGLVLDKDGRVYMTSDSSGELYVVTGTQKQGAPNTMATEEPDAQSGAKRRMRLQFGSWFW
jgi:glucose/arabinose dehydrogenase